MAQYMRQSIKMKMFINLIVIIFVLQALMLFTATRLMDKFLIYEDVKAFQTILDTLDKDELKAEGHFALQSAGEDLNGLLTIVDFNIQRPIRELDQATLIQLKEKEWTSDGAIYQLEQDNSLIMASQIADGELLVNIIRLEMFSTVKRLFNIYLGIATLIFFLILLVVIYFYINHYERKMTIEAQSEILYSLGKTSDGHFAETGEHIDRVSEMMYRFSEVLGMSKEKCLMMKMASAVHDIGKIAIPDKILKKPASLTEEEYRVIKTHPFEGAKILGKSKLPLIKVAREIVLCHHERVDGTGYPYRLIGDDIPMSARMMSIVDVYDALTHDRVYKKAISKDIALEMLMEGEDTQFDGELLSVFLLNIDYVTRFD